MKKLLIAVVLGLLLVAALATTVLADNGPHGSFQATTDACASCHRAHSAQYGANALLIMAPDLLCLSCHGGQGAGTNVVDGVYNQGLNGAAGTNLAYAGADAYYGSGVTEGVDGASLFAGGFTNALMATAWNGSLNGLANGTVYTAAVSRPTTSSHNHDGIATGTVWGAGANNSTAGVYALECISCHDPHGNAGWTINAAAADTKTASYRLLRWQPSGSDGFADPQAELVNWTGGAFPASDMGTTASATDDLTGWLVPDNFATTGTEWYTLGTASFTSNGVTTGPFAPGDYNSGNANNVYNVKNATATEAQTYIPAAVNVAYFCAQCHDRYFNNSNLRNNADSITSAYCATDSGGAPVADPTYTTNSADVAGASATSPKLFPVVQLYPDLAKRADCVAQVSYSSRYATPASKIRASWGDTRDSGDTTYTYRHSSGDIRVSEDGTGEAGAGTSVSRSCVACHVAHGTTAQMTAFASDATLAAVAPSAGTPGADINNSTLLRLDNRSICLRCHASAVGFTTTP